MKKNLLLGVAAVLFFMSALPAWAAPFNMTLPDVPGPLNGGNVTYYVTSPGASSSGGATLTFDLLGYLSVDGVNCCTDTFTLTVNGDLLFSGAFNMGGGGTNVVNFIDPGVTVISSTANGSFAGGLTKFSVAHTLLGGTNTYLFDYGVMQGLADEGWGLQSLDLSADVGAGGDQVPEPATMVLFGTGLAGLVGRRFRTRKNS